MTKPRTVHWELLNSKEAGEYLAENDVGILPVACIEMHGPIVPLGCDLFLDQAIALLLAEKWGCVVLPAIPYVYPGASGPWPGTIDIGPDVSIQYLKEVAKAALRAGFKRLIIAGMHGPVSWLGSNVVRSIYQETGQTVALLNAYQHVLDTLKEDFGWTAEDLFVLGALRVLGLEQHMRPETEMNIETTPPVPSIKPLRDAGVSVPWIYTKGSQHTGIHARLKSSDAERAAASLRKAVDRMANIPELFATYQREMAEVAKNPPWKKPGIWSV